MNGNTIIQNVTRVLVAIIKINVQFYSALIHTLTMNMRIASLKQDK